MDTARNPSDSVLKVAVSSLLSPPEPKRIDSFSPTVSMESIPASMPSQSFTSDQTLPSIHELTGGIGPRRAGLPPSPPISPYTSVQKEVNGEQSQSLEDGSSVIDPQLFRVTDTSAAIPADVPLFPPEQVDPVVDKLVTDHIARRSPQDRLASPTKDEYFLAISCVAKGFNRDPVVWWKREREFLERTYAIPRVSKPVTSSGLKRLAPAPVHGAKRQRTTTAASPRAPRVKRTPVSKVHHSFEHRPSASPKAPRAPTTRDDVDYQSLPDFSPPIETLAKGNNKVLKADWKGQVLDLSRDPDRHLLHEAEVNLAATLRLSCATYLCSKRRIFQARIDALRIGKEFRKTDAQQACKIDVNKASKLWSAYDRVGWFKKEYFEQYL